MKKLTVIILSLVSAVAVAQSSGSSGAGTAVRYATDAYPGFDAEGDVISPERKEPRWFSFFTGPNRATPSDQMAYCAELESEANWSKVVRQYDALVRNWPTSAEAPEAQRRMAELLDEKLDDQEESFAEYKYLVDFYSFRCDYNACVGRMLDLAKKMRVQGKTVVFFRFKNSTDVRRAFEACVLRAPGAAWAPSAMLTIGELREEEGDDEKAVTVYENLRNLHYGTPEAREAVAREAAVRMRLLRAYGYNRDRCFDTIAFLKMAEAIVEKSAREQIARDLGEAEGLVEAEAYRAARFYDSRMRTKRSAASAYEQFLKEYPHSAYAAEIRARLEELKGSVGQ